MRRIRVESIIEQDTDRVLLAGTDVDTGDRVTFHARGATAADLAARVRAGDAVEVEL